MERFKFLEHTADVKFQAFGKDEEGLFVNSSLALKESICGKIKIKEEKNKIIKAKGKDFESLLYNFLEEIIYLLDAEDFLISKIKEIKIKDFKLSAKISGDKASNYNFTNAVKAVTYNDMFVEKKGKKWVSQVVIDV
ncbi:Protein archease [uncultured archaeon]|nr:Protein archease [uncultured archaeon]